MTSPDRSPMTRGELDAYQRETVRRLAPLVSAQHYSYEGDAVYLRNLVQGLRSFKRRAISWGWWDRRTVQQWIERDVRSFLRVSANLKATRAAVALAPRMQLVVMRAAALGPLLDEHVRRCPDCGDLDCPADPGH